MSAPTNFPAGPQMPLPALARPVPPKYTVNKDRHVSTIHIENWAIETVKRPIMSIKEVEAAEKKLNLPLPEMTFGNNSLTLSYTVPATSSSSSSVPSRTGTLLTGSTEMADGGSVRITFNAIDALEAVPTGEGWEEAVGGGVRVSMADKWGKQRAEPSLLTDTLLPSKPVRPHDWTYSSTHTGSIAGPSTFAPASSPNHEIPIGLLSRQDPILDQILFYDDVPLFEDELHDNGESILNARIRVMPHSWFILVRLFVRVDDVLFRLYDVRLFHSFGSGEIIREVNGMEVDYDDVKAMLEKPSDLSPLTDANWASQAMQKILARAEPEQRYQGSEKGRQGGKAWPGLGKRLEVMKLPIDRTTAGGLAAQLSKVHV